MRALFLLPCILTVTAAAARAPLHDSSSSSGTATSRSTGGLQEQLDKLIFMCAGLIILKDILVFVDDISRAAN